MKRKKTRKEIESTRTPPYDRLLLEISTDSNQHFDELWSLGMRDDEEIKQCCTRFILTFWGDV